MARNRAYRSFAEFEREEIRPGMRIGWSVDELDIPHPGQELDFDADPYESRLWDSPEDCDDDEDEDE